MQMVGMEMPVLVLGDFNGHIGFIGEQMCNRKGEMMLEFSDRWGLTILNADDKCNGKYTRVQGEEKSVIDFYLANECMYKKFVRMKVDEDKEEFDLSDHCYIRADFKIEGRKKREKKEVIKEIEFYAVKEKPRMNKFIKGMEDKFRDAEGMDIQGLEGIIRQQADIHIKKKRKVNLNKETGKWDPKWMNEKIKNGIKLRRNYNKKHRNAQGDERNRYWVLYLEQKRKVQKEVWEAKSRYEKRISQEIKQEKGRKKMWQLIRKLRDDKYGEDSKVDLYEEGEVVDVDRECDCMINYWRGIYQKKENIMTETWRNSREEYCVRWSEAVDGMREVEVEGGYLMDIPVIRVEGVRRWMQRVVFTEQDMKSKLASIKNGKQGGLDGLKGEIYKAMGNSEICVRKITEVYNRVMTEGVVGSEWKMSKTCMIPKTGKPTAKEHRPIALTTVGYKLFMSLLKDRMVEQELTDFRVKSLQSGFMSGRRLEENTFILSQVVEECYQGRNELWVVAVDFSKAFDSVERGALVRALMKFGCEPRLIDVVVKLYERDKTRIFREGRELGEMEVQCGIRQGCTGSPQLFLMIVSQIIEDMLRDGQGYRSGFMRIPVLFYADDGLILARSREEAESMLGRMEEISGRYGLSINKDKSYSMVFNGSEETDLDLGDVRVVNKIRYLGVDINNGRDCFKMQKMEKVNLARRMVNVVYSVVVRASQRMLMGKVFWKSVILPRVLYGSEVLVWTVSDMEKIQRVENGVWRRVLRAPDFTPVVTLQGEVGCSSVIARDMKTKLKFARYLLGSENRIAGRMMEQFCGGNRRGTRWSRKVEGYLYDVGLGWEGLRDIDDREITSRVNEWEMSRWRTELESRSSLVAYRLKDGFGTDGVYENDWDSSLMFRARSNTLKLGWRGRFVGDDVVCLVCGVEEETLEHFLLRCGGLAEVRSRYGVGSVGEALGFGGVGVVNAKRYVREVWETRGRLIGISID